MINDMETAKSQKWFYEFYLPDGTKTESNIPKDVNEIHLTRARVLREYFETLDKGLSTALDISSHEGFFSLILAEYFESVIGLDKNKDSVNKAELMRRVFNALNIKFVNTSLEEWDESQVADFVLCYGLLYHIENPIEIIRKLASVTKNTLCIETQVMPVNVSGFVEDGYYMWQRNIQGIFGICADYSHRTEGGLTDISLIPSKQGLEFLLREFGFNTIDFYDPLPGDYEQFLRGHRIILFAKK